MSVEGGCETVNAKDIATPFVNVPFISVWGDSSKGAWGVNGDKRRDGCLQAVNMIWDGGGRATSMLLPDNGIARNSHMMMVDRNNLQVADVIQKWIGENAGKWSSSIRDLIRQTFDQVAGHGMRGRLVKNGAKKNP